MHYETTGQPMLFRESCTDATGTRTSAGPSAEVAAHPLSADRGSSPQLREPMPSRAVSPLASMALGEVCAFCGREVQAPGYLIPDYEELGAFCSQECADRRFRMYLGATPE